MKRNSLIQLLSKLFPDAHRNILYTKIMCGEVLVNGEKISDPSIEVYIDSDITIVEKKYVSRGGVKLESAIDRWNIYVNGKYLLDAGSSTGGFTDCLLKSGALGVHSVDVGYNQLAYSLRIDKRVNVLEKTNIMNVTGLAPRPHFAVADLSFRSINGAARHIINLTTEKLLIALVKPQFEIDQKTYPDFSGIIREKTVLYNVVINVLDKIDKDGLLVEKIMLSPIKGRKGNTEFIFLIKDNQATDNNLLWLEQKKQEIEDLLK